MRTRLPGRCMTMARTVGIVRWWICCWRLPAENFGGCEAAIASRLAPTFDLCTQIYCGSQPAGDEALKNPAIPPRITSVRLSGQYFGFFLQNARQVFRSLAPSSI
ncbi:hypothetical protein EMIT0P218_140152 [Pseudomonas sp. IT-P218]